MDIINGLDVWFSERLHELDYRPETLAYVAGVLKAQVSPCHGESLAGQSIVLAFEHARSKGNFVEYQRIGDWILFVDVVLPDSIKHEREVVETIGRLAYYSCYRMMQGRWDVYEELADQLPVLAHHVRNKLV